MKIKLDFVTNSSSCCYIIESSKKITVDQLHDLGFKKIKFNDLDCLNNIEQLIQYVDCEPCDWIKKATGPRRFWGASKESYYIYKTIIEEGKSLIIANVERNYGDVENFDRMILELDLCKVLKREYD